MTTIPFWTGLAGLIVLFLILIPLGDVLLRVAEWLVGYRFRLMVTERVLLAFFASGGLLYVIASIPLPIYGLPLLAGLLVIGAVAFAILVVRDHAKEFRATVNELLSWPVLAVIFGSLGLLALEVASGSLLLPNGVDGAVHALFVNEILRNHSIPTTLAPFSADGVIYPLGAPVWMTLPVLIFGWPIVTAPVILPPLFASLSVAAGFSLGSRLSGEARSKVPWTGLLFAAFFGLVASWPRLYVGGSYDFIFALPLFVVALGLFRDWMVTGLTSTRSALALGLFLGCITALSAAVGVSLILLMGGWILVFRRASRVSLGSTLLRFLAAVGVAAIFVVRSVVGVVEWFNYPGHVVTDAGSSPYHAIVTGSVYGGWIVHLDPFVPFKWRVSPIPLLSVVLQILLVAGIVLSAWVLLRPHSGPSRYLAPALVRWVGASTVILFGETAALLALGMANGSVSGIQSVTNVWETSILLFLLYQLIAVLPLVAATSYLRDRPAASSAADAPGSPSVPDKTGPGRMRKAKWKPVAAAVLLVTLGIGGGATVGDVPGYLHSYLLTQANGTSDNVAALEWASAHLPSCSRVLVAPGSAAQFLPEYASVHLVFPTFPYAVNQSYYVAVSNLTAGIYSNTTRLAMLDLGLTEVFATGQTTVTFPPFDVQPLEHASDFSTLFAQGDATILAFLPGVAMSDCPPSP